MQKKLCKLLLDLPKLKEFKGNKIDVTWKVVCYWKDRKHCEKMSKRWLPAFSPFPTMFSIGFFFKVVKNRDCLVKVYVIEIVGVKQFYVFGMW